MKEQRIITAFHEVGAMASAFNLDKLTSEISAKGWVVKQVVSTSCEKSQCKETATHNKPYIAITLLLERE